MKYLADGLKEGNWEEFYQQKNDRFLGDETFIERIKRGAHEPIRQQERRLMTLPGVADLGAQAQICFGVRQEELSHPGKDRKRSRIRQAFVEVGRKYYRFPVHELAKYLARSEPAISRMVRRSWEKGRELEESQQLRAFLEESKMKSEESVQESVKC